MQLVKNILEEMISPDRLTLAEYNASKGKGDRREVIDFEENLIDNLITLWDEIHQLTYSPGQYRTRIIKEYDKERSLIIAPFRDRVVHHLIAQVLYPIYDPIFIPTSYACRVGYGIHRGLRDISKVLSLNYDGTIFCLKTDIKKYYENIVPEIFKWMLTRVIGDQQFLEIIYRVIDHVKKGLPLGYYTSQLFANIYLTYFDHFVKETLKVKYYFRYMDDMVFLSDNKNFLHEIFDIINHYLNKYLELTIKENWQIFKVEERGIDFLGYKIYHNDVFLRKRILKRYYAKIEEYKSKGYHIDETFIKHNLSSYYGWLKHCSKPYFETVIARSLN